MRRITKMLEELVKPLTCKDYYFAKLKVSFVFFFMLSATTNSPAQAGGLDFTFNTTGIAITSLGSIYDYGYSIAVQPDGKIVVAGSCLNEKGNHDIALVRYNDNGTLDNTFSDDGIVTTDFNSYDDVALSVVIQPDGKIVCAGYTWSEINDFDFAVVRYNNDGTLDNTFSGDGKVKTTICHSDDRAFSVAIQPDGKIVVAGCTGTRFFVLVRYSSDGTLDSTFSDDGMLQINARWEDWGSSVAIQSDGKIIIAGDSRSDFAIYRFNNDGTPDITFSDDGKVTTDVNSDVCTSVAIQPDGKIVLAGSCYNEKGNYDFALLRYNSNGTLDNTFSRNGIVRTDIGYMDHANSIAIQPDGKIIAAGYSKNVSNHDFALIRYNSDGSLDNTFSNDGIILTDMRVEQCNSVAIHSNGKIVAAGYCNSGGDNDFAVVRYNGLSGPSGIIGSSLPDEFKLEQNYPNPFNPGTVIRWKQPIGVHVSLKVYDILGNEIAILIDELKNAGEHSVIFEAPFLSGGVYIYSIKMGNFIQVNKMVLAK